MPLANGTMSLPESMRCQASPRANRFPDPSVRKRRISGLYLYFCAYDQSHTISQDIASVEGSFWHGIMHRQEPDPGNSGLLVPARRAASGLPAVREMPLRRLGFTVKDKWDPFAFIDFCESSPTSDLVLRRKR